MARIRSIKPEFWTSEQIVECSTNARLLFIGLWNFCDDGGVHPASTKRLKMEVFPGDPFTEKQITDWITELRKAGLVSQYSSQGQIWWAVTGWHHQKIDRPNVRYPAPQQDDNSTTVRRPFDEHSPPEGSGVESNGEEGDSKTPLSGVPPANNEHGRPGIEELVEKWNRISGVTQVARITPKRRKHFNARAKDQDWLAALDESLERVAASSFCCGKNDRGWSADLGWFLRPDTQTNILEGKYDDKQPGRPTPPKQHIPTLEELERDGYSPF